MTVDGNVRLCQVPSHRLLVAAFFPAHGCCPPVAPSSDSAGHWVSVVGLCGDRRRDINSQVVWYVETMFASRFGFLSLEIAAASCIY